MPYTASALHNTAAVYEHTQHDDKEQADMKRAEHNDTHRSNTMRAMYSLGILGSCLENRFLHATSCTKDWDRIQTTRQIHEYITTQPPSPGQQKQLRTRTTSDGLLFEMTRNSTLPSSSRGGGAYAAHQSAHSHLIHRKPTQNTDHNHEQETPLQINT